MTAAVSTWLKEWLKTVPPGTCPACRLRLPPRKGRGRPAYVHSRKDNRECRAEYLRRRDAAVSGGTSLREVLSMDFASQPGRALLKLSCGCTISLQASRARRVKKRTYCPKHS